jgi:gas vesicle protein
MAAGGDRSVRPSRTGEEAIMARDEGAGGGSVLLAFILGAISGAAVALLYAPASGRETREYLGERASDARERAQAAADRGREAVQQGRETLSHAIERGREAYQQARARESA